MALKIQNFAITVIFATGYFLYLKLYALGISTSWNTGPFLNVAVIPSILGFIASALIRAWSLVRLGWVVLIPILSFVAFVATTNQLGDPAKPGIEYYILWAEVATFGSGALLQIGITALWARFNAGKVNNAKNSNA